MRVILFDVLGDMVESFSTTQSSLVVALSSKMGLEECYFLRIHWIMRLLGM